MGGLWSTMVLIILLLLLLLPLLRRRWFKFHGDNRMKKKTMMTSCRVPEGSWGWPFIGETLDFIASSRTSTPVTFMHQRKSMYGKVFRTHLLGKPVIVSTDPEINKVVLQNHGNIFIPSYPKSITELFGESSILRMNGALHKRVHASIGRFLKSPELKAQITTDIETSVKLSLDNWKNCDLVYIQDQTNQLTFEILVKVLMSLGPGDEMELFKKDYKEFIKGLICLPIKLPGTQLYNSLKAKERLQKMIRRIIEERLITYKTNDTTSNLAASSTTTAAAITTTASSDAIDVLLCNVDDRSDDDKCQPLDFVAGNIIEMMVPGEDSVPMVMTLAVKYLSDNPLALKQLVENMDLKRQKANSGNSYAWTDYMSLTFTQNVITETLRLANIINAIWRQATQDVEINGYLIPKGWGVLASLTSIHMDEQNYENPNNFDPWRWEKKGIVASSNTFSPFGGGQRLCPGLEFSRLEISIFLHHLVTTYRWVAEKDEIVYFPTVKMKQKLPIRVIQDGSLIW
ncbi:3-epi-6-deoxocathasterone 23-monooxygenase CYP90C1 isoform X2 [Spinacia oleracea]|uniref:3-epi-6-deoxocathasterone 23-monooxygenase CYP90C1 isoform X2 n=1 Tax=Spinacia oleracea TaxID=3562 RepID=A0A9R0J1T6_SPIOL|nr:3-epi-6-deoxocathasterone 23-monooxygenase CYP90C1 isoform X2 [Spinacia oleracea]